MTHYRGRRRTTADKLQGIGFFALLGAALLADGLLVLEPLALGIAVLASMVLIGGCLVWLGTSL